VTRPLLALVLLLAACGPYDVVVGEIGQLPDGGRPPPPGKPCDDSSQCLPREFCRKESCFDPHGRCAPRVEPDPCP